MIVDIIGNKHKMLSKARSSKGLRHFSRKSCLSCLLSGFRSDHQVISNNVYYVTQHIGRIRCSAFEAGYDFETGAVFSGYNDIRIPNETGTDISFSEELKTDSTYFIRGKINYSINDKHNFAIFAAPLRLETTGKVNKPVFFEGTEFPANTRLKGKYRFDSYRFTYRYDFRPSERLILGIGLTAKIRDAAISIEDDMQKSEKLNTGFVPLINFRC